MKPTPELRALDIAHRMVPKERQKEFSKRYAAHRMCDGIVRSIKLTLFDMGLDKIGAAVARTVG